MMLETEVFKLEPDITAVSCAGRFTLGNRLSETEALINSLIAGGVRRIVLDLTHVEFVDSAGLGIIMRASGELRHAGGSMRIAGAREQVRRLFEITHTHVILALDSDLETSVKKLLNGEAESASA